MAYPNLMQRIQWLLPIALFVLALAVRLPGLDGFITADEPKWIDRSRWFAVGLLFPEQECPPVDYGREVATQGLSCTLQIGYPGVTTMWAGAGGLLLHYWRVVQPTGIELETFLTNLPRYQLDPTVIAPSRLPFAVVGALFVPLLYGFLQRLFNPWVAVIAAVIIALHPYQIALSRVVHHDSFNTMFMVLSLLALVGYWLRGWPWYWLLLSAVLGGLALLSKQVSWFLPPFVAVLAGLTWIYSWVDNAPAGAKWRYLLTGQNWRTIGRLVGEGLLWGIIASLTFVVLFPAMWVIPGDVLQTIFVNSTRLVEEGHSHFFLGQVSSDPGPLFYPVGWSLRATPFEIIGLLGLLAAISSFVIRPQSLGKWLASHPVEMALLTYVGLLLFFVSISGKKMVRYFSPAFPILDVFAAFGWVWLLGGLSLGFVWILSLFQRRREQPEIESSLASSPTSPNSVTGIKRGLSIALISLIVIIQGWFVASHYPYYLTYHNPLFGGTPGAAKLMTIVGWGEGLNEAAAYLNELPDAKSLHVLTERACTQIRPFFVGRVSCLNYTVGGLLRADYIIYYHNVLQRDMPWPEQRTYLEQHQTPVHRVTLTDLDYVIIYRNPIDYQVNRDENSLPGILTTFGYNLSPQGQLTLFWQNLGLADAQIQVGMARSDGIYPVKAGPDNHPRIWLNCQPNPDFTASLTTLKAIIESECQLDQLDLSPGLYDLQLAVENESGLIPIESSRLAVIQLEPDGTFQSVELVEYESVGE